MMSQKFLGRLRRQCLKIQRTAMRWGFRIKLQPHICLIRATFVFPFQKIFSEMMQQRWTKWKDDNGTYIVPYYFSKSFPGTEENIHTINSHINWFNKAGFQIHETFSDWLKS